MSTNGHMLNRSITRRKTYTYHSPSSERDLLYRNVPLRAVIDFGFGWRQKHVSPQVPMPLADIAGEMRATPNPSDPDYQRALNAYELEARDASDMFLWNSAIVLSDEDKAEVREYREAFNALALGTQLDASDEEVFATHIVCMTIEEQIELTNAIYRISQPTREVVNQVKDRFPS